MFDDNHASRVLPGFQPDSKLRMLKTLADRAEVVIAVNAQDIESNKLRGDLGIGYDAETLRLIDSFREAGLYVGSVVHHPFRRTGGGDPTSGAWKIRASACFATTPSRAIPPTSTTSSPATATAATIISKPNASWWWSPRPAPVSGKMATCLSQLYHEYKRGIKAGYAKFETFPIWNLPLKHPVNLAYEAATADLNDVNMIDPYHMEPMANWRSTTTAM